MARRLKSYKLDKKWLARNGFTACVYCAAPLTVFTMTVDHFVPLSKGGTNDRSNLVPACLPCNQSKGSDPKPQTSQGFMTRREYQSYKRNMAARVDGILSAISKRLEPHTR